MVGSYNIHQKRFVFQVIKMLVAIVVLFIICWGPYLTDNVLVAFDILDRFHFGYLKYMREAFSLMAYFNSCVNPVVYAFMSKNFRESFKQALCACMYRRNTRGRFRYGRQMSFQTTRTTSFSLTRATSIKNEGEIDRGDVLDVDKTSSHYKLVSESCDERSYGDLVMNNPVAWASSWHCLSQPLCCWWQIWWPMENDVKDMKNDRNPGTWVPIWEYPSRAIQWIPTRYTVHGKV